MGATPLQPAITASGTGFRCPDPDIRCQMGRPAAIPGDQNNERNVQAPRGGGGKWQATS